jgi:2-polyprenyl-6-methoxyphenol hydroxylase-like FAD-dependent oxidoreductase
MNHGTKPHLIGRSSRPSGRSTMIGISCVAATLADPDEELLENSLILCSAPKVREVLDTVIIGGGIAGNALATVLARAGKAVLVLERSTAYQDRVRGEYLQPWGVAEARRLGLHEVLLRAGGTHHTRFVPYDETLTPEEAQAGAIALDRILPDVPGTLGVGHPSSCEALGSAAMSEGARILHGVGAVKVTPGYRSTVRYWWNGEEYEAQCRLAVGADGRTSETRRRAGFPLHATEPRLLGAGLLVDDLCDWPPHQITIGTEGDRVFFVLPQGGGRARLYLMYPIDQRRRFAGSASTRAFLNSFALTCIPESDRIVRAVPAGPCAAYPMNDSWVDCPTLDGLALIGDAAGYSDPHIGQGLSVALRDVRILSELLLAGENWSARSLTPYVAERGERMRRLRFCNAIATTLRGEFGPEARLRRSRARERMQADPELALWRRAAWAGPETVPAAAFDESVRERLFAPAGSSGT